MDIELLVVADCPNEPAAADLLRVALAGPGLPPDGFRTTVILDDEDATRRGFIGSPTFVINGIDPFAEPGQPVGLSCRIYRRTSAACGRSTLTRLGNAVAGAVAHDPAPVPEGGPA